MQHRQERRPVHSGNYRKYKLKTEITKDPRQSIVKRRNLLSVKGNKSMRRDNREDKLRRCKDELARLQQIRLNHTVIQDKAINGCHSKEQHSFNKILKQIQPNPQLNS